MSLTQLHLRGAEETLRRRVVFFVCVSFIFSSFNSEVVPHGLLVVLFTQTSTAVSKGQDVPSAGLLQRLTDILCAYG